MARNPIQHKLHDLLAAGWQVAGFTHTVDVTEVGDGAAASQTDGYTILLRKDGELAIALISAGHQGTMLTEVSILTGEASTS